MKGEALNNTLADTAPEGKVETVDDTMFDVKAKLLVDTIYLQPEKAESNLYTQGDVKAEAVVQTMADTTRMKVQDTS